MTTLFLIFNHQLTPAQTEDAHASLGVTRIIDLPDELKHIWRQIPSDIPEISTYVQPIKNWLASESSCGDYVLIQGDFGACWLMINFAFEKGLSPVYSTTKREASEVRQSDGSVKLTHQFKHQRFRRYGV